MRIQAKQVEVTLENGQVLHFMRDEGDTIVLDFVRTQPTGTPHSHKEFIEYYTATLALAKGQREGV